MREIISHIVIEISLLKLDTTVGEMLEKVCEERGAC